VTVSCRLPTNYGPRRSFSKSRFAEEDAGHGARSDRGKAANCASFQVLGQAGNWNLSVRTWPLQWARNKGPVNKPQDSSGFHGNLEHVLYTSKGKLSSDLNRFFKLLTSRSISWHWGVCRGQLSRICTLTPPLPRRCTCSPSLWGGCWGCGGSLQEVAALTKQRRTMRETSSTKHRHLNHWQIIRTIEF